MHRKYLIKTYNETLMTTELQVISNCLDSLLQLDQRFLKRLDVARRMFFHSRRTFYFLSRKIGKQPLRSSPKTTRCSAGCC